MSYVCIQKFQRETIAKCAREEKLIHCKMNDDYAQLIHVVHSHVTVSGVSRVVAGCTESVAKTVHKRKPRIYTNTNTTNSTMGTKTKTQNKAAGHRDR